MTNDKALEATARVIARDLGGDNYDADDWGVFASTAEKAISAYLSALPGEAEVVATLSVIRNSGLPIPIIRDVEGIVDSLQAMQARAEAAEERASVLSSSNASLLQNREALQRHFDQATIRAEAAERELETQFNQHVDDLAMARGESEADKQSIVDLEASVKEMQPILDWAAKQRRKPYSVTMLLDALKGGSNG